MIFFKRYKAKTDADLVAMASKGDQGAFNEIINRHHTAVYKFALYLVKDPLGAEDITQEVFFKLHQKGENFKPDSALKTFLLTITRNLCADFFRKNRLVMADESPEEVYDKTPFKQLHIAELRKQIGEIYSSLPEKQQVALYLHHEQGMSYKEAADAMGITTSSLNSLLSRGRKEFKDKFSNSCMEGIPEL